MEKIPVLKSTELGLPMTPATWVGEPVYKKYLEVLMTCGGGMGGSKWYEYIEPVVLPDNPFMLYVKNIDGQDIYINTQYCVKAQTVRVVEVTYNSRNPNYPQGYAKERWVLPEYIQNIKLTQEYMSRQKLT